MTNTAKTEVEIVSFGYLHDNAPDADITLDLRRHFRDPHINPELRNMTADDERVQHTVANTRGILDLVIATYSAVYAFAAGPSAGRVTVAVGCAGGRHRAPVFAMHLEAEGLRRGFQVAVLHRDMAKDVAQR